VYGERGLRSLSGLWYLFEHWGFEGARLSYARVYWGGLGLDLRLETPLGYQGLEGYREG